jgi:hypothetical protein
MRLIADVQANFASIRKRTLVAFHQTAASRLRKVVPGDPTRCPKEALLAGGLECMHTVLIRYSENVIGAKHLKN